MSIIYVLHWVAGLIVLAVALGHLETANLIARGIPLGQRLRHLVTAYSWAIVAAGGAGAMVTPLIHLQEPSFSSACVMWGMALLFITRARPRMIARAAALVSFPMLMFLLVLVWGLTGCASIKDGPEVIRLTPEQIAQCDAEGGCSVYTMKALQTLAMLGIQTWIESCRKDKTV